MNRALSILQVRLASHRAVGGTPAAPDPVSCSVG